MLNHWHLHLILSFQCHNKRDCYQHFTIIEFHLMKIHTLYLQQSHQDLQGRVWDIQGDQWLYHWSCKRLMIDFFLPEEMRVEIDLVETRTSMDPNIGQQGGNCQMYLRSLLLPRSIPEDDPKDRSRQDTNRKTHTTMEWVLGFQCFQFQNRTKIPGEIFSLSLSYLFLYHPGWSLLCEVCQDQDYQDQEVTRPGGIQECIIHIIQTQGLQIIVKVGSSYCHVQNDEDVAGL